MFSDNTALYFFSAWLQANAAILALVGVFVVYRIQSLGSAIDAISGPLYASQKHALVIPRQIEEFARAKPKEKEKLLSRFDSSMEPTFRRWIVLERGISQAKSKVRYPTSLLAVGIGVDSVGLFVAELVHASGAFWEGAVLTFAGLLHIGSMIYIVRIIFDLIRTTSK